MKSYTLENLDCANCALKIETELRKLPVVKYASVNFAAQTLNIDTDNIEAVKAKITAIEPGVKLVVKGAELAQENDTSFRREWAILAAAIALLLAQLLFEDKLHRSSIPGMEYWLALLAYGLAGWNVLRGAFRTIRKGDFFDENVLMTIATVGAFAIHAVAEAVGVMIFYKIGEMLQSMAVAKARRSIKSLVSIRPLTACIEENGLLRQVKPEEVQVGNILIVKAGEKIPLDGVVLSGNTQIDNSALTGESVPVAAAQDDKVLAGGINLQEVIRIQVTRIYEESSIARIMHLVESALSRKAKTEKFITTMARYYTPAVVFMAAMIAMLPPLLLDGQTFHTWIYRALVVLVISCPCALVVSIPLGYFGGLGLASRRGILIKGSNYIDALSEIKTVVFDKTGTLTKGVFKVTSVKAANGFSQEEILKCAAIAEWHSNHPIAKSIRAELAQHCMAIDSSTITSYKEVAGHGVIALIDGHTIIAGNDRLLHRENIPHAVCETAGTVLHVAQDGIYLGYITIGDEIKEHAAESIAALHNMGKSVVMLTGDSETSAKTVSEQLGITRYYAGLLPEDKVRIFDGLHSDSSRKGKIAFVGDGINDAPVIARADVGIAMGGKGSDAAIETADIVLMTDSPLKVAEAITIGKSTRVVIWQNIILALSVKGAFIALGTVGLASMWEAVFADMGVALLAILNALRTMRTRL